MTHRRKSNVREDLVLGNNSIGTTNSTNKISNHSTFHADDSRDNEGFSRSSRSTSHGWLGRSNNTTLMAPSIRGSRASSDAFLPPVPLEDDEEATNEKTATKETKSDSHFKPKSASNHSNKNKHGTKEKEKEKRKEKHKDTEKRGKEKETSVSTVPEEEHKPKKNKHKRSSPSSSTSTSSMTLVDEPTPKTSEKEKEKEKERIHFRITPHAQRPTVVAPPPSTSTATSSSAPSVSSSRSSEETNRFSSARARRTNTSHALRSNSTESAASQNRSSRTTTPMVLPPPVHHVANRTTTNPPTAAARARQSVNIISPMRPTQRNTSPPVVAPPDPDDDEDFQPDFGEANDSDEWEGDRRIYQEEEDDDDDDDDDYGETYSYMDAGFDPRHFDTEIEMEDEDIPISSMAPSSVPYTVESSSDDDDDEEEEEEEDDDGHPKKKKKSSDEESTTQRPPRSVPTTTRPQTAAASRFARNRNQHQHQQFQPQPDEWNGFTRRTRPRPQAVPAGIPFAVGPAPLPPHGLGLGRGASYHPPLPMSFSRFFGGRPPFEEDTDDEDRDLTGSGESMTSSGDSQVDRDAALARQLQMEEARSRGGFMYIQPPPLPQPRWRNNRQWGALVNDDDDIPLPPPIMFGTDGVLARLSNMFHRRHNHNHNHPPPGNQSLATNPLLRLSLMTRELNENDYELLLSLDEPVNKGAKKSQISTLPTREITDDEEVKSCCICLADMEPKSTVKTLPCNHYFHAECIDHWLQVNKVCPIDKKSIDGDENDADSKTKKS